MFFPYHRLVQNCRAQRLFANRCGNLVLVKAVLGLELLDESDVALLGGVGRDALVDDLLPGVLLGLALCLALMLAQRSSLFLFCQTPLAG